MGEENRKQLIFIVSAAMELCWLQAWCVFLLHSIYDFQVSILFPFTLFFGGTVTHWIHRSGRKRRILGFIIQICGLSVTTLSAIYYFLYRPNGKNPMLSFDRLSDFQKSGLEWLLAFIILSISIIIWLRSATHFSKPLNTTSMYLRFDLGISAIFALMVVKLFLKGKLDIETIQPVLEVLYFPLFLFGFLSIGMVLNASKSVKTFSSRFQKAGTAFGLAILIVTGVSSIILLFQSQAIGTAEAVAQAIAKRGPSFMDLIGRIILFLFSSKRAVRMDSSGMQAHPDASLNIVADSQGVSLFAEILKWGLVLIVIFVCLLMLRMLIHYLFAKTGTVKTGEKRSLMILRIILFLRTIGRKVCNWVINAFKRLEPVDDLIRSLSMWGKRSGLPRRKTDTLSEYGTRLAESFPDLKVEITHLVELIYQEKYREQSLSDPQIKSGIRAKNRMSHPSFWLRRIRSWSISNPSQMVK